MAVEGHRFGEEEWSVACLAEGHCRPDSLEEMVVSFPVQFVYTFDRASIRTLFPLKASSRVGESPPPTKAI